MLATPEVSARESDNERAHVGMCSLLACAFCSAMFFGDLQASARNVLLQCDSAFDSARINMGRHLPRIVIYRIETTALALG